MKIYMRLTLGCVMLALGVVGFFVPNQLLTGGTAGVALLLHYASGMSVGTWMVLINVPLLLLGFRYFGRGYVVRSIVVIGLVSVLIDVLAKVVHMPPFVVDTPLGALFGGVFIGVGLGLIIKSKTSAGGTTIIAQIVASKTELKAGQVLLILDAVVLCASLFVFEDRAKVLWSVVSIYVTSRIVDTLLTGRLDKKVVHLVTDKVEEFTKTIREELGQHGTIIQGDGLYGEHKKIILIVVEVGKLQFLRELVRKHDPGAFMIITEATEMLGRGD
ncbi:YitT family protein [Sulfurospirillum sp. T05]|uniref:YitT family protein n=1 Tax=Sulfurospirillum tamanense TaxID=2813362 RepID=A0ABS2WV85_9BACT|nr:YitT family protein [Sulfurospirillum tamanensis]MBN2965288.1 YitT family protein [Sulfurospirillum tamanensis]